MWIEFPAKWRLPLSLSSSSFSSQLNIYIAGEAIDNSPTFTTTTNNISSRQLTTTQYLWPSGSIPGWVIDGIYATPNFSAVAQELVNRPGWNSGNAMSYVFWSDLAETSERVADSYEGGFPPKSENKALISENVLLS